MPRTKTTEEFIRDAIDVHGDKYNYDKVRYINEKTDVVITCQEHGDFHQKPYRHLQGRGCHKCARRKISEALKMTTEEFICEAKNIHCDKYNYDKTACNGRINKVTITCHKHGDFLQRIDSHLGGCGCPYCAREEKTHSKEEFIIRARLSHGYKYNYDKVEYINATTQVVITCPIHGDFSIIPNNHTSKKEGCPYCNQPHLEEQTRLLLDSYNIKYETQKKFPWLLSYRSHPMRIDFYLPEYNAAIECQGEQHYLEEPRWVFTEEEIKNIKQRDGLKYNLCQEHGIPIYYIKYNENVDGRVKEIINGLVNKQ